ncbi:MAG: hypothetical protein AAGL34_18630 [Bacteroidota bacterium]
MSFFESIVVAATHRKLWKRFLGFLLLVGFLLSSCSTQRAIRLRNKSLETWQQQDSGVQHENHGLNATKE